MSRSILNPDIALRSWRKLPHMLIRKETPEGVVLTGQVFDLLSRFDGQTELTLTDEERSLLNSAGVSGFYHETDGSEELSAWQKRVVCDNLYFPAVEWRVTDRCNFNCLHCYNAADESANADIWDYGDALRFLDEARDCGVLEIRLSGGEPMLHPRFLDIVRAVYERGMYVGQIVTNGSFLTQEILDEFTSLGKKPLFKVSFDGFGYHDWMRDRPGAQGSALKAFDLLSENGFPFLVNAQINRRNKDSFAETLAYFDKLGAKTLRFIRTTEVPRWVLKAGDASLPYDEYYALMLDILREYRSKERKMELILWEFGIFRPEQKQFRMVHTACACGEYRDTMPACPTVRKQICVGASGNLYPCSQQSGIFDSRGVCLGNVRRDGLRPLLQSGPYLDLACMTVKDVKEHNPKCAACPHFSQCHGGCRGLGCLYTGDRYGENAAMCRLFELDYEAKVEELLPGWTNLAPSYGSTHGASQC